MSGGKGGSKSQTSTVTIPEWIKQPALRNIGRAETAQKIGYMPYYGPDVAAFNPTQNAAFSANIGAAEAFGLLPVGSLTAMQDMAPEPTTYEGGIQGYSSGDLFDQAVAELEARRPGQVAQYNKLFVNPTPNVPSSSTFADSSSASSGASGATGGATGSSYYGSGSNEWFSNSPTASYWTDMNNLPVSNAQAAAEWYGGSPTASYWTAMNNANTPSQASQAWFSGSPTASYWTAMNTGGGGGGGRARG